MNRKILPLLLVVLTAAIGAAARPIDAVLSTNSFRAGDALTLRIDGVRQVGVESDLLGQSADIKAGADGLFNVGKLHGPGLFFVTVVDPKTDSRDTVPILVSDGPDGQLTAVEFELSPARAPAAANVSVPLMEKVWKGLTAERLKAAAASAANSWPSNHAVDITTVFVVCVLPGGQTACAVLIGEQIAGFAGDVLEHAVELMAKDKALSREETDFVLTLIRSARVVGDVATAKGAATKAVVGVAGAAKVVASGSGVELTASYGGQMHKKFSLVIRVAKAK